MTELAELQRRAFARDSSPAERAAAEAELVRLAADAPAPEFSLPELRRPATVPRAALATLLGAVSGILVVAAVNATVAPPAVALEVFERPATARDAQAPNWAAGDDAISVRWLADDAEWDLYGYRTTAGEICLTASTGAPWINTTCLPEGQFARQGVTLTAYYRATIARVDRVRAEWLPDGSIEFDVATIDER